MRVESTGVTVPFQRTILGMLECLGGHKRSTYGGSSPVLDGFLVSSCIACPIHSGELMRTRRFTASKWVGSLGELNLVSAITIGIPFSENIPDNNDPLGDQINSVLEPVEDKLVVGRHSKNNYTTATAIAMTPAPSLPVVTIHKSQPGISVKSDVVIKT